jgi:hypothetical protein
MAAGHEVGIFDWDSVMSIEGPKILYVRLAHVMFHSSTLHFPTEVPWFNLLRQVPSMDMVQFLPRCLNFGFRVIKDHSLP